MVVTISARYFLIISIRAEIFFKRSSRAADSHRGECSIEPTGIGDRARVVSVGGHWLGSVGRRLRRGCGTVAVWLDGRDRDLWRHGFRDHGVGFPDARSQRSDDAGGARRVRSSVGRWLGRCPRVPRLSRQRGPPRCGCERSDRARRGRIAHHRVVADRDQDRR